jgi:tripartite-type tricarboxylate transporter receptor subunit TctC
VKAHKLTLVLSTLVSALAVAPAIAGDAAYPTRPVRFICPFPPGGAADMVTRMLAQRFTDTFRHQVVVDNRSGAGGVIGVQLTAKAPADGYTLLLASSSNYTFGPALEASLSYDPMKDFTHIARAVLVPNVLVAHPSAPRTIVELVRAAKASPGKITYASPGTGTTSHLIGVLFERAAGISLLHVPYKGGGPAVADLVGGHVQLSFGSISTSLPLIKSGKVVGLGVTSSRRSTAAPDLPTIAESGLPGFEAIQWFGVAAPAGLSAAITNRLNGEINAALGDARFQEQLQRTGLDVAERNTPAEFQSYIRKEMQLLTRQFREAGLRAEQIR